jgi:hypothetical protein
LLVVACPRVGRSGDACALSLCVLRGGRWGEGQGGEGVASCESRVVGFVLSVASPNRGIARRSELPRSGTLHATRNVAGGTVSLVRDRRRARRASQGRGRGARSAGRGGCRCDRALLLSPAHHRRPRSQVTSADWSARDDQQERRACAVSRGPAAREREHALSRVHRVPSKCARQRIKSDAYLCSTDADTRGDGRADGVWSCEEAKHTLRLWLLCVCV